MIHVVVPHHFHTESLLANKLSPVGLKVCAVAENVKTKGGITMPSDRRTGLFVCIGVREATSKNIGFFSGVCNVDGSFDPVVNCESIGRIVRIKIDIEFGRSGYVGRECHGG